MLENEEGKLVSSDRDGIPYVVREWFTGRECDTKSASDILEGVKALARLHSVMQMPLEENYRKESLLDECTRHNREIRKIGNFIRKKNSRTDFEMQLLRCMDSFLKQGGDGSGTAGTLRISGAVPDGDGKGQRLPR